MPLSRETLNLNPSPSNHQPYNLHPKLQNINPARQTLKQQCLLRLQARSEEGGAGCAAGPPATGAIISVVSLLPHIVVVDGSNPRT